MFYTRRLGSAFLALVLFTIAAISVVQAGALLTGMQVPDTCGTTYADKLASCTPVRCTRPGPLSMSLPSKDELKQMSPQQRQDLKKQMASVEKRLQKMSAKQRAALKARMVSKFEIKGFDDRKRCKTVTMATPQYRQDCSLDQTMMQRVSGYTRLAAGAEHIQIKSTSRLIDGKMVTEQTDIIDGKPVSNPWQEALRTGQCTVFEKSAGNGWKKVSAEMVAAPGAGSGQIGKAKATRTHKNTVNTATPAQSQISKSNGQSSNTLFILDASGSMWGQINGKPKITIAKEVLARLVQELPENSRIGLIAYGHRRKGDCNDVETLVKLGANNRKAVLHAVKNLNAIGKTPLTRTVNQAINMLRSQENTSTVVLISDGIESCGGNPCAAVKAAKASGVNFILHTVGFGLSKKEAAQLQCMARAGGGQYFQANNAEELLKSARKAVKSKGPGALKVTLRANGKAVNAWVAIRIKGSNEAVVLTNDAGVKPGHKFSLRPGKYYLELLPAGMRGVNPVIVDNVEIKPGKTVKKILDFDQVTLRLSASNNGSPAMVQINVRNLGTNKVVFDTSTFSTFTMNGVTTPYDIRLSPGRYRLTVAIPKSSITRYSKDITLTSAGTTVNKSVSFASGTIRVAVLVNKKPAKAAVYIAGAGTKHNVFETMPYVGADTPLDIKLAASMYDLYVTPIGTDGLKKRVLKNIEVKPGSLIEKILSFEPKPITTDASGMEQDTDRPGGGDFRHFSPVKDDPALCRQACQKNAQCKAWTYVKPNTVQGPKPNCWLKQTVPPAIHNTCCISGLSTAR